MFAFTLVSMTPARARTLRHPHKHTHTHTRAHKQPAFAFTLVSMITVFYAPPDKIQGEGEACVYL